MWASAVSRAQPSSSLFSQKHTRRSPCCHVAAPTSLAYDWEVLATPRLEQGGRFFIAEERIRSFEVGSNQQSDLVAIANLMQETAGNHIVALRGRSEQYYAADPELAKLDLIFVLTRMQIRMTSYPRWGDIVGIKTYFQSEGRVGARRDWTIHNARTEETRLKLPDLPAGSPVVEHTGSPVYVDMNNHLNNTAYLTWILDSIPDDVLSSKVLAQYEVEYKAEGNAGDEVVLGSAELEEVVSYADLDSNTQPQQFVTEISKKTADGELELLIRARTTWI